MGSWSDYCIICGAPFDAQYEIERDSDDDDSGSDDFIEINHKWLKWLEKIYVISNDDTKIRPEYIDSGEAFDADNNELDINTCPLHWNHESWADKKPSVACHRNCYKLLKSEFDYKLKFVDVVNLLSDGNATIKNYNLYGKMADYSFDQDFNTEIFGTDDEWLLKDPTKNNKNKKRILKMWSKLIENF